MKIRRVFQALGLLATFSTVAALGQLSVGAARAGAQESIKQGYLAVISFAPIYLAEEKGFFAEEGLKVDYARFVSGAKMAAPLATGEIQVAAGSMSAGFFNALAQGSDVLVVADKGQTRQGYGFTQLVVRKDLIDSGRVKSIKDFKGLTLATNAPMNVTIFWVGRALQSAGLSPEDVNWKFISFPNQLTALKNKAVDAVGNAEPWGAQIEKAEVGVRFLSPADFDTSKDLQVATIMYNGAFARERRSAAQKYMNAYVKAVRYYNERGMKDAEVVDILHKWTKAPKDIILSAVAFYLHPDAMPNLKSISDMQDYFFEVGAVKKKTPIEKFADVSFVKKAAGK